VADGPLAGARDCRRALVNVTVLGSSGAQPAAGDACSGYLFQSDGVSLLVDCGTGVLSNLQRHIPLSDLTAIIVSHMHPDHWLDLVPLRYGIQYGNHRDRVPVWLPPGGMERAERVGAAISVTQPFFDGAYEFGEYAPEQPIEFDGITATPIEVRHNVRSFGLRIEAGGRLAAYSSDTSPCEALSRVARDADLFIAENTYGGGSPVQDPPTHLTSLEAGEAAARGGAERLLLSHFWPTADRARCCNEAADVYGGHILNACPNVMLEV
jgi:ribonuclease BN (tRNA processing enzyme)